MDIRIVGNRILAESIILGWFVFLFSCAEEKLPVNHLPALYNDERLVININNWRLVGPFSEAPREKWEARFDSVTSEDSADYVKFMRAYRQYDGDTSDHTRAHSFLYVQTGSYQEFDKLFNTQEAASSYAVCTMASEDNQDVAFQMVMDDAVKVWVNGKLCIRQYQNDYITKNKYAYKVHLNKGENNVVVKLYNTARSAWGFNLGVTSAHYAKKYPMGKNYFSFSDSYLLGARDAWKLKLKYPSVLYPEKTASLSIQDAGHALIRSSDLPLGGSWEIPLTALAHGVYSAILRIDNEVLEQRFVRGDYKVLFSKYLAQAQSLTKSDFERINVQVLQRRFHYLEAFGERNAFDEQIQRKISSVIFDLANMAHRLEKHEPLTKNASGWHLRGFRSTIDGSEDNYMVYVPERVNGDKKFPLVVIMPYVGLQAPFIESYAVANIDRNEMVESLSRKYGMAVLWPSARIVTKYNMNPIVYASTFEAINAVKQDYPVDDDQVYLFGSCSGGLQAMITANRFPAYFAAVAVDGPDLGYTKCEREGEITGCSFPASWTTENSILNTAENYRNLPVYLFHSKKDEKADFALSDKLASEIRRVGGTVFIDDLNNPIKQTWVNMIPDNALVAKSFEFFKTQSRPSPDTIDFSTYQLKYNQAYWITIDDLIHPGKGSVHAVAGENIIIETTNIGALTVDLKRTPGIDPKNEIRIVLNGTGFVYAYPEGGLLNIKIDGRSSGLRKTHLTEGPISDIFSSPFWIVKGTSGSVDENAVCQAAVDTLVGGWLENLYSHCGHVMSDKTVTDFELKNANLILVGTEKSNSIIRMLKDKVPLTVSVDHIRIGDKTFAGNKLVCLMLYPNPYNAQNYVLIVTTNYAYFRWDQLKNLPVEGWYDYQVWNDAQHISSGNFARDWQ